MSEHHSTPLNLTPSPSVFLSAAAQRTRRLRLGALVYILPAHHPLRLAEEICMLDHLSHGRLEVGIGRGASAHELQYFGIDPETAPAMYVEAYTVIRQAPARRARAISLRNFPSAICRIRRCCTSRASLPAKCFRRRANMSPARFECGPASLFRRSLNSNAPRCAGIN